MKKMMALILVILMMLTSSVAFATDTTTDTSTAAAAPSDMGTPPDGSNAPPDLPDGTGGPGGDGTGGPGGASDTVNTGTGATTLTADETQDSASYTSSATDENALRVENNASVSLTDISVTKTGDTSFSGDSNFYGLNASVLVLDGATLTISGGTVTSDAEGANGVYAYGTGTAIITDMTVRTSKDSSGGIMLAGGGTLTASNMDVETQGGSSAAIRTDRGGGTMTVDGGTYVSNGIGSPAVYCTADVAVSNATLTANHSEGVVIEGKNVVSLTNCDVSGNMTESAGGQTENMQTIFIYQSMSGDSELGRSDFSMTGGSLTSLNGDTFYVTNTSCTIELNGVAITNADGALLKIEGNSSSRGWGTQGANGGTCDLTATNQALDGEIIVDAISSLNLNLTEGSSLNGTINQSGDAGEVNVTIDGTSTWTLTADAHITSFTDDLSAVNTNGFSLYVGGELAK